jgi:glycosyltransferase involved in cell wall biosynthesis
MPPSAIAATRAPGRSRSVCFVAPFGLGQKTTVWARTLPLARDLVRRGWTATILIPPWDTPADAGRTWQEDGVEVVNVALRGGLPATTYRLLHEISRRDPAIVHIVKPRAHAGLVQWLLWQTPRRARPALLLDIDDWEQAWAPINRYPRLVARFLAWQEEWGIRHADGVTAASRWLEAKARAYNPGAPVCYLPNGITPVEHQLVNGELRIVNGEVSTPRPSPLAPRPSPLVLFFTRFVEVTPAWLADFWRALHAQAPSARLAVAGSPVQPGLDEPFRAALAAVDPIAAGQVIWLGYAPQSAQPGIYAAATCAIFPAALTPLQEAKCSVRLATTLLAGVPVVASAVGEQAHYGAAGAARLVPADASPAAFAAAVTEVLADPARQAALSAAAQQHLLTTYAWERLGKRLEEFYLVNCG